MRKKRKSITFGINAQRICPNSGPDTESVSQYTASNQQKMNGFDAITKPCTTSVHAEKSALIRTNCSIQRANTQKYVS